jgi:hypothetical protein
MRPRTVLALAAAATALFVRPVAATPIDRSIGMLSNNAAYFQAMVNAIDSTGRRTRGDSAGGGLIGAGHSGRLYAVGGAAVLGIVAAFVLPSHGPRDDQLLDRPVTIPGGDNPGGDNPANDGTLPDIVDPNLPPGAGPDGTTVTPEPGSLLLLSTGLSTLGAATVRRRRTLR